MPKAKARATVRATIVKRIPPVPIAVAVGLVNLVLGLILGILTAVNLGLIVSWLAAYAGIAPAMIPLLTTFQRLLLIVVYPISGFVIGFLGTLIVVAVYNWIAKKTPIKLELK